MTYIKSSFRNRLLTLAHLSLWVVVLAAWITAQGKNKDTKRLEEAAQTATNVVRLIEHVLLNPNAQIPKELVQRAQAIGFFSLQQEGQIVTSLFAGTGVVSQRIPDGWQQPIFFQIGGASLGPRVQFRMTDLVIFFMNSQAAARLLEKSLVFQGKKKPAAGPTSHVINLPVGGSPADDIYFYAFSDGKMRLFEYHKLAILPDNKLNEALYGAKTNELLQDSRPLAPRPEASAIIDRVGQLLARAAHEEK